MSMSSGVVAFRPADEEWKRMKKVWDACKEANISPPDEVVDFFNDEFPDKNGVRIDIERTECCKKYSADMMDGFEVDITKLPKGVKIIRFYNSY